MHTIYLKQDDIFALWQRNLVVAWERISGSKASFAGIEQLPELALIGTLVEYAAEQRGVWPDLALQELADRMT